MPHDSASEEGGAWLHIVFYFKMLARSSRREGAYGFDGEDYVCRCVGVEPTVASTMAMRALP